MTTKVRLFSGLAFALIAGLTLSGCVSSPQPTNTEPPSTSWRDNDSNQEEIDPDNQKHVSDGDVSRQDGAKEIKFVTTRVEEVNPTTGKTTKTDKTTVYKITVNEITPLEKGVSTKAITQSVNNRKQVFEEEIDLEEADTYKIQLTSEMISGYDKAEPEIDLAIFWPATHGGAIGYLLEGSDRVTHLGNETKTMTLLVAFKANSPAPDGVRYIQYDRNGKKIISPKTDIFSDQGVAFKQKEKADEENTPENEKQD